MNHLDLTKIYETLERQATAAGTNLTQVCRDADVNRSIVERWKKENPKTLNILARLLAALEKAKDDNSLIPPGGSIKATR